MGHSNAAVYGGRAMSVLQIRQSAICDDRYRVELRLDDGTAPLEAAAEFDFSTTPQDQEDLRWYLEDFLQYPQDPGPQVAARVEERLVELGTGLFRSVFQANDDARDLWAVLRGRLDQTKVEVITSVAEAASIPWELIRDPKTGVPLTLRAAAFVRAQPQAVQRPELPQTESGPIRILLVICRPGGGDDVPFRSVASRLLKGLSDEARAMFQLDVLRPATFGHLADVLRQANADGQPYHVVHFDGHGAYLDMQQLFENWQDEEEDEIQRLLAELLGLDRDRFSPQALYPRPVEPGTHGYLVFEDPDGPYNKRLVDARELSEVLVETGAPVLVLNACRSAHAEAPTEPRRVAAGDDPHGQIRAYGSFAQEVIDAGVAGVVAMRYNVYVVTAAQFVANLYAALARGHTLGEAVTLGRKQLAAEPMREIASEPRPLQDWCVPVVYEAAPIGLFPRPDDEAPLAITLDDATSAAERGSLDEALPRPPDAGFFGRDEVLLALDRAFDAHQIVLLHAYAGSGKTATAAEFARWYAATGGVQGPVLFTTFEHHMPLPRVLDRIGQLFGPSLEQAGVNWLALDDDQRRKVALDVLRQVPVFWIWDNVEPVAGFPAGSESAYTPAEQQELADFLRDARQTRARFLLTSRRDERCWLGDNLPHRIAVGPMPMQERVQLAREIAKRAAGNRLHNVADWRPLLRFTAGNPLTITVLVGQALRDGLETKAQIEHFVAQLRAGEARFTDEASEGRTGSLGASLSYGFEHAFTEAERKQLALLHLFQGFVDVRALRLMGSPEFADHVNSYANGDADFKCLSPIRGLTHEAGTVLLDQAAEIGLLSPHGGGYYTIHPALPWFFKDLFDRHFPSQSTSPDNGPQTGLGPESHALGNGVARTFAEAMGQLGSDYHMAYCEGHRNVVSALRAEEANLLHAGRLACSHEWWRSVTGTMQGLRAFYRHTGCRAEWARLVREITHDFVDAATDGPLPGREEDWPVWSEYRVQLAEEERQWAEAERLQRVCVEWARRRAEQVVHRTAEDEAVADRMSTNEGQTRQANTLPDCFRQIVDELTSAEQRVVRTLATSLHKLGDIQRERKEHTCVEAYHESMELADIIGARSGVATCAFTLGHAYMDLAQLRDLNEAERWYDRSLQLWPKGDGLGRARSFGQLGTLALERFNEARAAGHAEADLLKHLNAALASYRQSLELLPEDAVDDLAVTHNQLGAVYQNSGDMDRALPHFRKAIRLLDAGNRYGAGRTRLNVAVALARTDRLDDAREYALAALQDFEPYGDGAANMIKKTRQLLAEIERLSSS